MTSTVALSDIAKGDTFRIDEGPARKLVFVDYDENSSAVRVYYKDSDPRYTLSVLILDVMAHDFYRV